MAYIDDVLAVAAQVPIFPCRATDFTTKDKKVYKRKRPHIKNFKELSTQEAKQIRKWWKKWPDALVGVPTGRKSGLFVIDFDAKNGTTVEQLIDKLPEELDELEVLQQTRRGLHAFFKMDPDKPVLRNGTDVFWKGIDTRGEGGYIIVAPSEGYSLESPLTMANDVPDWVYEHSAAQVRSDREKDGSETQPPEIVIETLNMLDPKNYQDYGRWTRLMLACFHSSEGNELVKQAFKVWSQQDEVQYNDQTEQQIDEQWEAAATDIDGIVTFKTLVHEVRQVHGAYIPDSVDPFDDVDEIDDIQAVERAPRLDSTSRGIRPNFVNLSIILSYPHLMTRDNPLFEMFQYNQLSYKSEFIKDPPWATGCIGDSFDDGHAVQMATYIGGRFRGDYTPEMLMKGVDSHAKITNAYHPIQDYLNGLTWDGVPRLENWLIECAGAKNTPYIRTVSKKFIISAVARGLKPGSKVDTMLVLEGPQGIYKSSLIEELAGDWYRSPGVNNMASKESSLACLGAWICEIEEMESLKISNIGAVKKFITTRKDTLRFVYDRTYTDIDRGFVLVGTINPSGNNQYVHDVTGARRFWPITCNRKIRLDYIRENRDQIFAEGVARYVDGEQWWLDDPEEATAQLIQSQRISDHTWEDPIKDYVYYGAAREYETITSQELYNNALGHPGVLTSSKDANHISRIMVNVLGWEWKASRLLEDGTKGAPRKRFLRPEFDLIDIE